MRRLTFGVISALILTGTAAPAAMAEVNQGETQTMAVPTTEEVTPFDLTYLTYSGGLEDYGIEGGNFLIENFRSGEISAQDIVSTAVAQELVSDNALDNSLYIDQVDDFLQTLARFDP